MKIKIEGIEPKPCPRPRFSRYGSTYMPKDYQTYKKIIADVASKEMEGLSLMEGALQADIKLFCTCKKITGKRSGDCDNLAKGVMDALNSVVYVDDSQIVKCSIAKYHSETPMILVEVKTIDDVDDQ